jgi:bifunctional DNA-binding transcriptional regulator/antitoxin component of YhaV-PrlF toxin-antitoxin module
MSKVTSKLQVTLPKALADRYRIHPGDEIDWVAAGDSIRVMPSPAKANRPVDSTRRLELFDQATERQRRRQKGKRRGRIPSSRGWKREDLYVRVRPR